MTTPIALVGVFIFSTVAAWLATGWVIRHLQRYDIVDKPNARSSHDADIVRGGGIAITFVIFVVAGAALVIWPHARPALLVLLAVMLMLAAVGYLDDRYGLSIASRLAIQLAAAILAASVAGPLGASWWAWPFTVLWVVWMINTFNFMDGIDGIAAQQACLCGLVIAVWFAARGAVAPALAAIAMSGAALGFGRHNWTPATVFLGDTGSLALGGSLAVLALIGVNDYDLPAAAFFVLYALFLGDTTVTLIRRLFAGKNVLNAHNEHLYQRAVRCGMSHVAVTKRVIALNLFLMALASMIVAEIGPAWVWIVVALALLSAAAARVTWLEHRAF